MLTEAKHLEAKHLPPDRPVSSVPLLDQVGSAVASSKKYVTICPETIRLIAARELAAEPHASVKALVKATKRGLYQICGAFEQSPDYEAAYQQLEAAYRAGFKTEIEAACRRVLALHSSTRERLPILDQFYTRIFQLTGQPRSILDLGCGLNPVALPWMGLAPGSRYAALDIDAAGIQFVNRYLQLAGFEPLARWQDILADPPADPADVALLLKTSPSLERQEKGVTACLVEALRAPFVVVSFAVKSLGGREKGMLAHHRRQFQAMAEGRPWQIEELASDTELVFVVRK
jgi:16S rRNA (guanine(1405)-N(7))-methyltransferase